MSEEQLWHDICLVRFCGRKFRYRGSWKRTFLFQPVQSKTHQASSEVDDDNGPEISDSMTLPLPQVVPSMSAPRGIMSEYLQRQYFFRSLHLGHFVPESGPDPRFCCLHEAQWKALNAIDFSKRYTQQSLPVALKQLCVKWPVSLGRVEKKTDEPNALTTHVLTVHVSLVHLCLRRSPSGLSSNWLGTMAIFNLRSQDGGWLRMKPVRPTDCLSLANLK